MQQRLSLDVLKHELKLAAECECGAEVLTQSLSPADLHVVEMSTSLLLTHLDDLRACALLIDPMFSKEHAVLSKIHVLFRELNDASSCSLLDVRSKLLGEYAARAAKIITKACES